MSADLPDFMARLGHRFHNLDLLRQALTHGSASSPARPDNQRLEFLGDRVLGLVIAEALLNADRTAHEGQLAPRYNALVRKEACAAMAEHIHLGDVLRLGRSERMSGGRRKTALLGDAMEAVIAAVYVDGGFIAAERVILRLWSEAIARVDEDAKDAKTRAQEWAQARSMTPPVYIATGRSGPDHAPEFTIEARLDDGTTATARAATKRKAEQDAAAELLKCLIEREK